MRQFLAEQSRAEQSRAEQSRAERNNYIDFLRGIASIGIIAIHTAFLGRAKLYTRMVLESNLVVRCPVFLLFIWMGIKL